MIISDKDAHEIARRALTVRRAERERYDRNHGQYDWEDRNRASRVAERAREELRAYLDIVLEGRT